jgi:hypothetical protein
MNSGTSTPMSPKCATTAGSTPIPPAVAASRPAASKFRSGNRPTIRPLSCPVGTIPTPFSPNEVVLRS